MSQRSLPSPQPDPDALTQREREVLTLLAQTHLSNQDIAGKLFLALNSVKWYARQIYAKLGVRDREQAVARARELGLLASPVSASASKSGSAPLPQQPPSLPIPLTPFIGRENDVKKISQMLAIPAQRLITLSGTGGVGKTRLAIQVAGANGWQYPQGVWFVELGSLSQGHLVAERTAAVFGLLGKDNRPPAAALKDFLRGSKALLILDCCEHLIDDCAKLVEELLQACPQIQVLATSREALGIAGETLYTVPPLTVPALGKQPDARPLAENEAVQLFVNRATAVRPEFRIQPQNQDTLAYICNRLEGIPLALELAAARLKVLELDQIAANLETSFQLLTGGGRTAPARHKTMEASIDWSYKLLTLQEQQMLAQLAVFDGGWTLEAAQAVCGNRCGEPAADAPTIDLLSQLIDKSLVVVTTQESPNLEAEGDTGAGEPYRYRMLEPIHQYALKKLRETGGEAPVLDRHLAYFLSLAETSEAFFRGADQVEWVNRFEREIDNFRLALDWALRTQSEGELRLGSALMAFWQIRGRWEEGLEWLQKGLSATRLRSTAERRGAERVRAKALCAAGSLQSSLLLQQQDSKAFDQVFALFDESLAIFRRQRPEDRRDMAFALIQLARSAANQLAPVEVAAWANQSLALYREEKDGFGISECLAILANNERNPARAREAYEETIKIKRSMKDIAGLAQTYADASSLLIFEGEYDLAETYLLESLGCFRRVGNLSSAAQNRNRLAWIAWVKGNAQEALARLSEALDICRGKRLTNLLAAQYLLRGEILLSQGNLNEARQAVGDALSTAQENPSLPAIGAANAICVANAICASHRIEGTIEWIEGDLRAAARSFETALAVTCGP